jgi:hypothetical protein
VQFFTFIQLVFLTGILASVELNCCQPAKNPKKITPTKTAEKRKKMAGKMGGRTVAVFCTKAVENRPD